ncbi:hypothetical protein [Vallitalea maricola]|uniref:Uncharacterized protein n=1 Tax=Vallitalea maricola TaxID=3074433 RepID=A0ACB5UFE9_9FIRM|nr:hypothetical protein AN2V17_04810 [Vallitalea sp. AN17-2]
MKKTNINYIINYIIILVIAFFNYKVINHTNNYIKKTYNYNILLVIFPIICLILFGISIGLISFFKEINTCGKWKKDTNKLIIIGLPSLIISLLPLLVYIGIIPYYFAVNNMLFISKLFQILLGYTIISSFHK